MRLPRAVVATAVIVAISLVLAIGLHGGTEPSEPLGETEIRAPVQVVHVERRALATDVLAGGFLRAREDVTVSAERPGRLVRFLVPEGAAVRAGQVVADLEDTVARSDLERVRAAYREAALDPNVPAAELARLREALVRAEHELSLHHPTAPIGGVVEVHHVDAGEFVTAATPLLDIMDTSVLVLDVEVDAEVAVGLRPDVRVTVRVPAAGRGGLREGRITRLGGRADPRTRRFPVEVSFAREQGGRNGDGGNRGGGGNRAGAGSSESAGNGEGTRHAGGASLKPGMYAEARFVLPASAPAVYVPKAAVRTGGPSRQERFVFLVSGDRAVRRPVEVEEVYGHPELWRLVGDGLPEGALVVVGGFSGLTDGGAVEVLR